MRPIEIRLENGIYKATLPLPPIVNHRMFVMNGRMVKASENRSYEKDVAKLGMGKKTLLKPLGMEIVFYRKIARGDIDGRLKTLFDALAGVIYQDDGQIEEIHVWNKKDANDPRVELIAYEL